MEEEGKGLLHYNPRRKCNGQWSVVGDQKIPLAGRASVPAQGRAGLYFHGWRVIHIDYGKELLNPRQ